MLYEGETISDLNQPDVDIIKKRLLIKKDDASLQIKKYELQQMEYQQQIKKIELEKEVQGKIMKSCDEELALYDKH